MSSPPAFDGQFTPPQVAEILRKDVHDVLAWIRSGQLRAYNLGSGSLRPRYRVPQSALESFLESRLVIPPTPRPKRRAKAKPPAVDYVAMMRLGGRQ